jgi:redox-sensitive bicupin YhaK (pirin superfamily)
MVEIISASKRHFSDFGWLKTYWLFSFSDYYDPENVQFGALRVFNDDVVEPGMGFPTHPHEEMEIVTVVLDGEMMHADSMGNKAVIRVGDVQRMSAGTGLTHSEFNLADAPVHFYQIWIYPDEKDLTPSYDQKHYEPASWQNQVFPVASGQDKPGAVTFHTDATIYRADLEEGKTIDFKTDESRRIFVYLTKGDAHVNGRRLASNDQARIDLETAIQIEASSPISLVLIDVPSCKGWGYDRKTLSGARKK